MNQCLVMGCQHCTKLLNSLSCNSFGTALFLKDFSLYYYKIGPPFLSCLYLFFVLGRVFYHCFSKICFLINCGKSIEKLFFENFFQRKAKSTNKYENSNIHECFKISESSYLIYLQAYTYTHILQDWITASILTLSVIMRTKINTYRARILWKSP